MVTTPRSALVGVSEFVFGQAAEPGSRAAIVQILVRCLLVALIVFALAWTGIWLTREADRVASIWFANAFLLSIVLGMSPKAQIRAGVAALIANVLANLVSGDALAGAVGLALCNTVEVFAAVWALGRFAPELQFSRVRHQILFVAFAGVLAPMLSSMIAALLLWQLKGAPPVDIFWAWFPADALGMLIIFPIAWSMRNLKIGEELAALVQPRALALLAIVLIVTALVFAQARYPLLFVILRR